MRDVRTDPLVARVAARYKGKKVTEEGNTVYMYSERQVALRNRQKAERVEKLRGNIEKLRSKVQKDLTSSDPKTKFTALAIALIDHTYERVGNDESASERGHFGVTGWLKKHVSFGKNQATIKYVGKSGVKQEKRVTDSSILKVLREAHEGAKGDETCLFEFKDGCVDASTVNDYLKSFDITAKDLRGLHANREMQERLTEIRSKGPELPRDRKEKDKILKAEFKKALEGTAEAVGHEAATLRSQYLVPSLEDAFMKDGTVIKKLNEKTAGLDSDEQPPLLFADRIIQQIIEHSMGGEYLLTEMDFLSMRMVFRNSGGSWERYLNGDTRQHELLQNVVKAWAQMPGKRKKMETV